MRTGSPCVAMGPWVMGDGDTGIVGKRMQKEVEHSYLQYPTV